VILANSWTDNFGKHRNVDVQIMAVEKRRRSKVAPSPTGARGGGLELHVAPHVIGPADGVIVSTVVSGLVAAAARLQ